MDSSASVHDQAQALLARLASQCQQGFGSMSASIYDTAWLSMVQKDGKWLFPECFDFLLEQQLPSGPWESYATPLDGILNTAAALLALKKHLHELDPEQRHEHRHGDLLFRSHRAEAALKEMLHRWDVASTDQVGFELLLVSLLNLLEKEVRVLIDFPGLYTLRALRDAKLAKLPPPTLYRMRSTLHHALEAFIGHIDFDRLREWREPNGSMMASPAATAGYLMNASVWDDEAEAYLRRVLRRQRPKGIDPGSVPCAWPTTIFEISWAVTTLKTAGVTIGKSDRLQFRDLLEKTLLEQKGLLGFAPGGLPDVDDTAKGIEALHHLSVDCEESVSIRRLHRVIETYEADEHFITYPGERNPSFSANCNVLILLLTRSSYELYIPQIAKAARFLTRSVLEGHARDKWHLSKLYWMMLLARAFELFFHYSVAPRVFKLAPALREDIPMVTLHILLHILQTQQADGSWGGVCEVTSYAILALSSLEKLPWIRQLDSGRIVAAMALGKSFLHSNRHEWTKGRHLWIEKVTYSSSVLSEAYCLAAAIVPLPSTIHPQAARNHPEPVLAEDKLLLGMRKAGSLIARTELFSKTDPWALRIAEMQACFAMQAMQRQPVDVFPRRANGKDKYLFIIPLALTASALEQRGSDGVCLSVLYEMMVLSILNFHADEYMEDVVERCFADQLDDIRKLVRQIFTEVQHRPSNGETNGATKASNGDHQQREPFERSRPTIADVKAVLARFVSRILHHPAVLSSPASLQSRLAFELETFLLAHITQAEANRRFRTQCAAAAHPSSNGSGNGTSTHGPHPSETSPAAPARTPYHTPSRTFYNWVRSTSADHTSCPFSFVFFHCLVQHYSTTPTSTTSTSNKNTEKKTVFTASARTAYLAEDLCRHLASLCRMFNDAGSARRDAEEGAVNSLDFPEFFFNARNLGGGGGLSSGELLWIAEYERRGLEMAMQMLEEELGKENEMVGALRLFVRVTDLYGQIYVLQDVGKRTR
ncbi:Copalyl diphosphate synthase [Achaetomium macrosporum]|uniref:Copalyl diphosphate synthase n=1 Tax=Achaetomium macrosporum TaxID=79813 RepID=A0AAN7HB72_9PEZI|nr:Copalyl diphosphate synthase [Achaetomium macrosporum]